MATIVTRSGKGSALTHTEMDNNFTNLNTDKPDVIGTPATNNVATFDASDDIQDGGYSFTNCNAAVTASDEELNYSVGVTSAIQTQLTGKLTASSNLSDVSSATTSKDNLGLFDTQYPFMYLGSGGDGSKTVSTNETWDSGEYHYTDLTINVSQTVSSTESSGAFIIIRCTGTVLINGDIDLDGVGASGALGVVNTAGATGTTGLLGGRGGGGARSNADGGDGGASASQYTSVVGGVGRTGSNGVGGAASTTPTRITNTLPSFANTKLNGAGGGAGGNSVNTGGDGGNGGGGLVIIADTITFNTGAVLTADGANGTTGVAASGGGGGGGVILLYATTITNDGAITVTGGAGGTGTTYDGGAGSAGVFSVVTLT